jgi:predicted nucleic acid-binding protein
MSQEGKPRVVFDCMVFLQAAARGKGPAAACLRLLDTDAIVLLVSDEALREVRDVLRRPCLRQKNPALTDERIALLFQHLAEKAVRPEHRSGAAFRRAARSQG